MEKRFHEIIQEKAMPRSEYREVLSRLDALEKDVALVRGTVTQAEFSQGQAQLRAEFREDLGQLRR